MALACGALAIILTHPTIAQASSKGALQEQLTKEQELTTDGSQKLMDASKKFDEAMNLLDTKQDYAKAIKTVTEADWTMAAGEKELSEAQKLDDKLLQEIRKSEQSGQKMVEGASIMRYGARMLMKQEKAGSRAHKIVGEGKGILDKAQETASQL